MIAQIQYKYKYQVGDKEIIKIIRKFSSTSIYPSRKQNSWKKAIWFGNKKDKWRKSSHLFVDEKYNRIRDPLHKKPKISWSKKSDLYNLATPTSNRFTILQLRFITDKTVIRHWSFWKEKMEAEKTNTKKIGKKEIR